MFYEKQPIKQQHEYKALLMVVGGLSNLFSDNRAPYIAYRAHENIFCRAFQARNRGRDDSSADATKDGIGVGLKTWTGNDDQKVAEFGQAKKLYSGLEGMELVRTISKLRNERIRITLNKYGLSEMIYHVVKRIPNSLQIMECPFDPIDIENIKVLPGRGKDNNTYFFDGKHTYHFSVSKNTLYMLFENLCLLDTVQVKILDDPYSFLMGASADAKNFQMQKLDFNMFLNQNYMIESVSRMTEGCEQICLPLYSVVKGEKCVPLKSGLNQWNASGRRRDFNEMYIPYRMIDKRRNPSFFPPRDTSFSLRLPDGSMISAKVCQDEGKAIMSNPNKVLGKWLLRDVFELPEGTIVTYDMLLEYGIDSVVFTKYGELEYSVDFSEVGTYEEFYGEYAEKERPEE